MRRIASQAAGRTEHRLAAPPRRTGPLFVSATRFGGSSAYEYPTRLPSEALMMVLSQAAALMIIFNSTGGPSKNWGRQEGWGRRSGSPCEGWFGVCCRSSATEARGCQGADTKSVTGLLLSSNKLIGTLPADPAVWSSLAHLQSLSLRSNALSGSLPPALGQLSALVDLNLRNNHLSGSIPAAISQLRQFRGNLGLGGCQHSKVDHDGGESLPCHCNSWLCPVPPVTWLNGTASRSYASCTMKSAEPTPVLESPSVPTRVGRALWHTPGDLPCCRAGQPASKLCDVPPVCDCKHSDVVLASCWGFQVARLENSYIQLSIYRCLRYVWRTVLQPL